MERPTPELEIQRANEAAQIMNNGLVKEALSGIKEALVEQWRQTPLKDAQLREQIWAIYAASCKFEQIMQSHIETGKMVAIEEERKRTLLDRARSWAA